MNLILWLAAIITLLALNTILLPKNAKAAPVTFTVTNTNDSGAGSLREAINGANTNGNPADQDIIEFAIPGLGNQTIQPQTSLNITQSVLIDGYTQADAIANTLQAPGPLDGILRVEIDASVSGAINITGSNVTLQGLVINRSFEELLNLNNANSFRLFGSYIDVDPQGLLGRRRLDVQTTQSIVINSSDDVRIGGGAANERNVLGKCFGSCIEARGTTLNTTDNLRIQGNNFGVGSDGITDLGTGENNWHGKAIDVRAGVTNARIGGEQVGEGNSIERHTDGAIIAQDVIGLEIYGNRILQVDGRSNDPEQNPGVLLGGVVGAIVGSTNLNGKNTIAGSYNSPAVLTIGNSFDTNEPSINVVVSGNSFGVMDDEVTAFPNQATNILVRDDSEAVTIQDNIIRNSEFGNGISIVENAQLVSVLRNSIYNNVNIGIDINFNGTDINDNNDTDSGPNELLNRPGYTNISESGGNTDITFTMDVPAGDYRVEFFSNTVADPSGHGEGEVYLGFSNVTSSGIGNEEFNTTITGTGHTNLALTATRIDVSSPTGYGPTSEFGSVAQPFVPVADLSIEKTLLNPEDVAFGNTLNYQVVVTNNGPNNFDMTNYSDETNPASALFIDVMPPELSFTGITGPNISCLDYGPGSASLFGTVLANHADHTLVACARSGGDTNLASGQSLEYIVSAEIVDPDNMFFTNHVIVTSPPADPDAPTIGSIVGSGADLIDGANFLNLNNYSSAYSVNSDLEASIELLYEDSITPNGTVRYRLTFTNNGPSTINPTLYDLSGVNPALTALFIGVFAPNLTFNNIASNPDVVCNWNPPGSAGSAGIFSSHPDYSLMTCGYFGEDTSLAAGESISTELEFTAGTVPDGFVSYVIGGSNPGDPHVNLIFGAYGQAFTNNDDALDLMRENGTINNFAYATYSSNPNPSPNDGSGNANNGLAGNQKPSGSLSNTGSAIIITVIVGLIITVGAVTTHYKRQHVKH